MKPLEAFLETPDIPPVCWPLEAEISEPLETWPESEQSQTSPEASEIESVAFELIEDPADVGVTMMLDWVERLDPEAVELREVDPAVVERGST